MGTLRASRLVVVAAALLSALCAAYMLSTLADERRLENANALALDRDYQAAAAKAREVESTSATGRAKRVEAYALLAAGDIDRALPVARRALREQPLDWELRRDYAFVLALRGNREPARREMSRALAANPRMAVPFGFERTSVERP